MTSILSLRGSKDSEIPTIFSSFLFSKVDRKLNRKTPLVEKDDRFRDTVYLAGVSIIKVRIPWLPILSLSTSSRYTRRPVAAPPRACCPIWRGERDRGKETALDWLLYLGLNRKRERE